MDEHIHHGFRMGQFFEDPKILKFKCSFDPNLSYDPQAVRLTLLDLAMHIFEK